MLHYLLLVLLMPFFELLLALELHPAELRRRMDGVLSRLLAVLLLLLAKCRSFSRLLLPMKMGFPLPRKLPDCINHGHVSTFPSSLNSEWLSASSSGLRGLAWSLNLLQLLLRPLLGDQFVGQFEPILIGPEVLGLAHVAGQAFQLHPSFKAFPWRPTLCARYHH
jgi:hypothetical protein